MLMVYDNLDDLFVPSIVFLFASLIFVLFGFLRQGVVNKLSFSLVAGGIILSVICDSYGLINDFYTELPYEKHFIMITYAISQLLVIVGLAKEKIVSVDYFGIK